MPAFGPADYDTLILLWSKMTKLNCALNDDFFWPPQSPTWYTGTVTSVNESSNTLTDSSATGWVVSGNARWNAWDGNGSAFYDVAVDVGDGSFLDYTTVVHFGISGNTSDTLSLGTDYRLWIQSGQISGASDLVGFPYRIISGLSDTGPLSGAGGWLSIERWPIWEARNRFVGTVTSTTAPGDGSLMVTITGDNQDWTLDQWRDDYDLVYTDTDGKPQRGTIRANTADTLKLTTIRAGGANATDHLPTGTVYIVAHSGFWHSGENCPANAWYRSLYESTPSHVAEDHSIGSTIIPQESVDVTKYDFDLMEPYEDPTPAFDREVNTFDLLDNPSSSSPAKLYTPKLFKCFRGLQVQLEAWAGAFVYKRSYEGYEGDIRNMVGAEMFESAGINSYGFTASVGFDGDNLSTGITGLPGQAFGLEVDWAVFDHDNVLVGSGHDTLGADGVISGSFDQSDYDGKSGILSPGWTRYIPREFRYMFDKTCYVPDDPDSPSPTEMNPGSYVTRDKSTNYTEYDSRGKRADKFDTSGDGADEFVEGELARLVGENQDDPTLTGNADFYEDLFATVSDKPTDDNPDGQSSTGPQGANITGTATGGDTTYLTVDSALFWRQGDLRTDSGTATSGSTTSLTDSTKASSAFWTNPSFGRWLDWIVEVRADADSPWIQRPISSHSTTTISWSLALPFNANGKEYRIRERLEKNKYAGRMITITAPGGTNYASTITHSDDTSVWFGAIATPVQAGWTFSIEDQHFGRVYRWDGSKWIAPTGTMTSSGDDFPTGDRLKNVDPYNALRFGRTMKGDYFGQWNIDEINSARQALGWTLKGYGWTANSEDNFAVGDLGRAALAGTLYGHDTGATYDDAWTVADGLVASNWSGTPFPILSSSDAAPFLANRIEVYTDSDLQVDQGAIEDLDSESGYAYPTITGCNTGLSATIDFMGYGWIDESDSAEGMAADFPNKEVNTFDPDGTTLQYHKWATLTSAGKGANDSDVTGSRVGDVSTTVPSFEHPDDPLVYANANGGTASTSTLNQGYWIGSQTAILKWDTD